MGFSASVSCSRWQGLWLWVCSHVSRPHPLKWERSDSWRLFARRWEWLHQRLPDGALPAWRQALRDRGRHQWSAQTYHRQGLQRSFQVTSARGKRQHPDHCEAFDSRYSNAQLFSSCDSGIVTCGLFPTCFVNRCCQTGLGRNESVCSREGKKYIFLLMISLILSVAELRFIKETCCHQSRLWAVHLEQEVATAEHKLNPKKGWGNNLVLFLKSSAIK